MDLGIIDGDIDRRTIGGSGGVAAMTAITINIGRDPGTPGEMITLMADCGMAEGAVAVLGVGVDGTAGVMDFSTGDRQRRRIAIVAVAAGTGGGCLNPTDRGAIVAADAVVRSIVTDGTGAVHAVPVNIRDHLIGTLGMTNNTDAARVPAKIGGGVAAVRLIHNLVALDLVTITAIDFIEGWGNNSVTGSVQQTIIHGVTTIKQSAQNRGIRRIPRQPQVGHQIRINHLVGGIGGGGDMTSRTAGRSMFIGIGNQLPVTGATVERVITHDVSGMNLDDLGGAASYNIMTVAAGDSVVMIFIRYCIETDGVRRPLFGGHVADLAKPRGLGHPGGLIDVSAILTEIEAGFKELDHAHIF